MVDAMLDLPGRSVELPYHEVVALDEAGCLEARVRESGADVRVRLEGPSGRVTGTDGGVGRYGLQTALLCHERGERVSLDIEAGDPTHPTSPLISFRFWPATDARRYPAARSFAIALAALGANAPAREVAVQLAASGDALEKQGDAERAAIAWMLATRRAEVGLDSALEGSAFSRAEKLMEGLKWTRYYIVLLNNSALYRAPEDAARAQELIDRAVSLQQQKLDDAILANILANNVCLIRYQYGDLTRAESCFRDVLARHELLGSEKRHVGATRNNAALVDLSRGRYRTARDAFRRAAAERLAGDDRAGYVISLGNVGLCDYQLGDLAAALRDFHEGLAEATRNGDDSGRARMWEYLAAVYLAVGDTETAAAYAESARSVYASANQIAELAPVLRLLARIELERGRPDEALARIGKAWHLAVDHGLKGPAANIAPIYARILLETGRLEECATFLREARSFLRGGFHATDLAMLDVAELGYLRSTGQLDRAGRLARRLLAELRYPGVLRTRVLVEQVLIAVAATPGQAPATRSYQGLLDEIRRAVGQAPDPELALRTQELARPATEAIIAGLLDHCPDQLGCTETALGLARNFFALEPLFEPRGMAEEGAELRGLLQALSQAEASGQRSSVLTAELKKRIKLLQADTRLQAKPSAAPLCEDCSKAVAQDANVVFFLGNERGWRWQREGRSWTMAEVPGWSHLRNAVVDLGDSSGRPARAAALAPLVAALHSSPDSELVVAGDSRAWQVPYAALPLEDGGLVIDRFSVRIATPGRPPRQRATTSVRFVTGDTEAPLPSIVLERAAVHAWADKVGMAFSEGASPSDYARFMHVSAHGRRDVGSGTALLWVGDQPILSFLSPETALAETVLINACESAAGSTFGLAQSSIATSILRGSARQVVATLFPVSDRDAGFFAQEFYGHYDLNSNNLSGAVRAAQQALRKQPSREGSWAAYVTLTSSLPLSHE
jgi:tetratricopeptide (TPR) repeat protein